VLAAPLLALLPSLISESYPVEVSMAGFHLYAARSNTAPPAAGLANTRETFRSLGAEVYVDQLIPLPGKAYYYVSLARFPGL
jgi:hypothetical protein